MTRCYIRGEHIAGLQSEIEKACDDREAANLDCLLSAHRAAELIWLSQYPDASLRKIPARPLDRYSKHLLCALRHLVYARKNPNDLGPAWIGLRVAVDRLARNDVPADTAELFTDRVIFGEVREARIQDGGNIYPSRSTRWRRRKAGLPPGLIKAYSIDADPEQEDEWGDSNADRNHPAVYDPEPTDFPFLEQQIDAVRGEQMDPKELSEDNIRALVAKMLAEGWSQTSIAGILSVSLYRVRQIIESFKRKAA